jgi:CheY-like chemotaxis protein
MELARQTAYGARGRAVVADDEPDQRALVVAALEDMGFEVSTAADGRELLDLLSLSPPRHFRVVVTDQRMPGLHGTEVLARTSSRRTPFVIVTGDDGPQIREQATMYGAAAFVLKPLDLTAFTAVLDEILLDEIRPRPIR